MQARRVFHHGLVPVSKEPLAAVPAPELRNDLVAGLAGQLGISASKGRIANDGEQRRIHFLGVRFTRQDGMQRGVIASNLCRFHFAGNKSDQNPTKKK
jgi:hypothetical protein